MPNFQTDTLLASDGDVYTQLMDVIKAYMEARGWTSNLYHDYRFKYAGDDYVGKRLHAQKTINSIDRFINIRSMKNQQIFARGGNDQVTGIGVIGSTGYDGDTTDTSITSVSDVGGFARFNVSSGLYAAVGDTIIVSGTGVGGYDTTHTVTAVALNTSVTVSTSYISNPGSGGTITVPSRWDRMTGYTLYQLPALTDAQGGGALDLPVDVLTYFLFSENSGDNIYLICGNSTGYTGILFGVTTTENYFVAGSNTFAAEDFVTNLLLTAVSGTGNGTLALRKKDNTDWNSWSGNGNTGVMVANMEEVNSAVGFLSVVDQLLFCSPDNFKGNNPLIPTYMGKVFSIFKYESAGVIPGIKYVNMKLMDSLTELTFGGDVYKLFRLYTADDANDATVGLALLK